jgi:Na+/melibiose symporter-like transporter
MAGIFARERIVPSEKKNSVGANFKMMWRNKPFRQLLISGILGFPRNITLLVAIPMVTYYFASKDPGKVTMYIALIGGGLFIGMFGATGMVPKLLDRFSKKSLYNFGNLVEILPNLSIFVLFLISTKVQGGLTNVALLIPVMAMFAIKGICLGLFNALQTTMIADAVDYEDYTHHVRPDGVFFSGQTFTIKIGTGIANAVYGFICAAVLFSGQNVEALQDLINHALIPRDLMVKGSTAVVHVMEKTSVSGELVTASLTAGNLYNFFFAMFFAVSIIPAIGNVLAVIPTWKYALDRETYEKILVELQERRRTEGKLAEAE